MRCIEAHRRWITIAAGRCADPPWRVWLKRVRSPGLPRKVDCGRGSMPRSKPSLFATLYRCRSSPVALMPKTWVSSVRTTPAPAGRDCGKGTGSGIENGIACGPRKPAAATAGPPAKHELPAAKLACADSDRADSTGSTYAAAGRNRSWSEDQNRRSTRAKATRSATEGVVHAAAAQGDRRRFRTGRGGCTRRSGCTHRVDGRGQRRGSGEPVPGAHG